MAKKGTLLRMLFVTTLGAFLTVGLFVSVNANIPQSFKNESLHGPYQVAAKHGSATNTVSRNLIEGKIKETAEKTKIKK